MVNAPAVAADELTRLLGAEFPQVWSRESGLSIEEVWSGGCRLRQAFREHNLRPGATISGAAIMQRALLWHLSNSTTTRMTTSRLGPATRQLSLHPCAWPLTSAVHIPAA